MYLFLVLSRSGSEVQRLAPPVSIQFRKLFLAGIMCYQLLTLMGAPQEEMNQKIETYYEVLRVDKKASGTEILAAYHAAKGAFSREALAGYGVFSQAEVEACLKRIEEAYQTLSDPSKRNSYDKLIEAASENITKESSTSSSPTGLPEPLTGLVLKAYREQLHLSLEEVFRITRIPVRYLKAIEEGVVKEMPARVYLQGFVKNLAHVYKLPPNEAAKLFLEHFDKNLTNSATS